MKSILTLILMIGLAWTYVSAQMAIVEDVEKGTVTVKDGNLEVLTYRFGDQLKEGSDPEQTRSCYIHPLYSLDGQPLTDDFPTDHLHHHGLCWTWPVVKTRGQETQTWHPANLRQYFLRWLKREVHDNSATIGVENVWKLDGQETVAKEIVTVNIHPVVDEGRAIDLDIRIEAVGGPLTLQGTTDQNKGYGGFSLRGAPMFKGLPVSTDQGEFNGEPNNLALCWADLSTEEIGIAIFVSPDHPDFPPSWILRNSYAGFLNVSWPGLKSFTIQPGKPVTLRYRLYIHRGDVAESYVRRAYERYITEYKQ